MSKKILIIGQALPAVEQTLPYDTTMLYEWLEECGISKLQAKEMFEFEAVYGAGFTGYNKQGGHKPPTKKQMNSYWDLILRDKWINHDKVWILGGVAEKFLFEKAFGRGEPKSVIVTIHPSRRNIYQYRQQKDEILRTIRNFLNEGR